jgi:hypothetical protein
MQERGSEEGDGEEKKVKEESKVEEMRGTVCKEKGKSRSFYSKKKAVSRFNDGS